MLVVAGRRVSEAVFIYVRVRRAAAASSTRAGVVGHEKIIEIEREHHSK